MPSGASSRACPPLSLDADGARPGRSFFFASLSSLPPCGLLGSPCSVRDPTSSLISLVPSFLFWALPPYGWLSHLLPVPRARQGRAARGALSPTSLPDARPRSGLLCLLLGLCEPTCVRVRVSTCLGASVYALCPGSGLCLWSPGLSVLPLVHHGAGQGRLLVRGMDSC